MKPYFRYSTELEKQPPEVFCSKGILRNFRKFTGRLLCQRLFIKKESLARVFSCEFCEISKNTFLSQNTPGVCFWKSEYTSADLNKMNIRGVHLNKKQRYSCNRVLMIFLNSMLVCLKNKKTKYKELKNEKRWSEPS